MAVLEREVTELQQTVARLALERSARSVQINAREARTDARMIRDGIREIADTYATDPFDADLVLDLLKRIWDLEDRLDRAYQVVDNIAQQRSGFRRALDTLDEAVDELVDLSENMQIALEYHYDMSDLSNIRAMGQGEAWQDIRSAT